MKKIFSLIFILLHCTCFHLNSQSYEKDRVIYRTLKEAKKLHVEGNYSLALDKYKEAFNFKDVNWSFYLGAGYCAIELKNYEDANFFFLKSINGGALDIVFFEGNTEIADFKATPYWANIIERVNYKRGVIKKNSSLYYCFLLVTLSLMKKMGNGDI